MLGCSLNGRRVCEQEHRDKSERGELLGLAATEADVADAASKEVRLAKEQKKKEKREQKKAKKEQKKKEKAEKARRERDKEEQGIREKEDVAAAEAAKAAGEAKATFLAMLRDKPVSELRKRLHAAGADATAIDEATRGRRRPMDAGDPVRAPAALGRAPRSPGGSDPSGRRRRRWRSSLLPGCWRRRRRWSRRRQSRRCT